MCIAKVDCIYADTEMPQLKKENCEEWQKNTKYCNGCPNRVPFEVVGNIMAAYKEFSNDTEFGKNVRTIILNK